MLDTASVLKDVVARKRIFALTAAGVHVFTALGAVCGLLAALAAFEGAWERMFVWLGLAGLYESGGFLGLPLGQFGQ